MEDNLEARRKARERSRRKRRRERQLRTALILMTLACVAVIVIFGLYLPWSGAESAMPSGELTLQEQSNGTLLLTWPQAEQADAYRVEVISGGQVLDSTDVSGGNQWVLEELPQDREVTIRVSSLCHYRAMLTNQVRLGANALEVTGTFTAPEADIGWTVQLQPQSVIFNLADAKNSTVMLQLRREGIWQDLLELTEPETAVVFGDEGLLSVPKDNEIYEFRFIISRMGENYIHYGISSQTLTISREDLLGKELNLTCTEESSNNYTLRWNETQGEYYEVQRVRPGSSDWVMVCRIYPGQARSYSTGYLQRYSEYKYRVVVGGQPEDGEQVHPEEVTISTGGTVVYSTVWPLCDLDVYADTDRTQVIGTAPAVTAYCVLEETEGLFRIRCGPDTYGYIDSSYCMINLPEYMGDLCTYDITNSYDSLIMVHDYIVPGVTGTTILGYENVMTSQGGFLVPLLYPVAQRLERAALSAQVQGYRLKIFDGYRAGDSSRMMYDTTLGVLDDILPDYPYDWEYGDGSDGYGGKVTYRQLMTDNGRYTLSYFMAKNGSRHNQGVALDLTLEDLETGEELEMQTAFNDLSWYSEVKRNNENSRLLASIMKGEGFAGLSSEWWHFQDDEIRNKLGIDYYQSRAVSGECWMASEQGWQYRLANGNFYANITVTIDGVEYTFNRLGYVVD